MTHTSLLPFFTAAVALGAGVMDVRTRRISNWFTLPSLVVLLLLQGYTGGLHAFSLGLLAATVAGGIFLLFFMAGGMGVVLALRHGRLCHTVQNIGVIAAHHYYSGLEPHSEFHVQNHRMLRLPYAVAITAGTLLTISLQGLQR